MLRGNFPLNVNVIHVCKLENENIQGAEPGFSQNGVLSCAINWVADLGCRPQGKVMFSQVSVCPQSTSWILVHYSALLQCGRYASYWNDFLFLSIFTKKIMIQWKLGEALEKRRNKAQSDQGHSKLQLIHWLRTKIYSIDPNCQDFECPNSIEISWNIQALNPLYSETHVHVLNTWEIRDRPSKTRLQETIAK